MPNITITTIFVPYDTIKTIGGALICAVIIFLIIRYHKRKNQSFAPPEHDDENDFHQVISNHNHSDYQKTHQDIDIFATKKSTLNNTSLLTPDLPYKLKGYILTRAEYAFYSSLRFILKDNFFICPKIGLKDIFYVPNNTIKYKTYWYKIAQKHVDFVICEINSMIPICAIELDDSSHNEPDTIERDNFVNQIYESTGFPLIRYKVKQSYTREEILSPLLPYISTRV